MPAPLLPEGFRDRLPPAADAAARLELRVLETVAGYGYERVDPALVEFEQSLAARLKAAGTREAVRFIDPISQQSLAIRPDITAQVGRIAATRMAHHPRPLRLSYAGSVLRLRASELAPEREQRQVGCELIGYDNVAAAREAMTVAVESLRAIGLTGISIDFTLPDILTPLTQGPLPVAAETRAALVTALDVKDAGEVARLAPAYLPLIEAAGPFGTAINRLRAMPGGTALASRLDGLERIADDLDGVRLTLDPTERHGFEYHSWFGVSFYARGANREVGRGGSYAILTEDGEEPAVGFSLFPDAILDAAPGLAQRRRLFVPPAVDRELLGRLRAEGWATVMALAPGDSAEAQLCSHILTDGEPRLVG